MSGITRIPGAMLLGAGMMYFLDPARGRKRRARAVELATHTQRKERELVGKAKRDAAHRARGLSVRVHQARTDAPGGVLEGRLRAHLGRVLSHPGAIEVEAHGGRVILRGPILAHEAEEALSCARRVPGVHEVIDRLERHARGDEVPALQGEGRRRGERESWPPAIQVAAIGGGALLAGYGLVRRGLIGTLAGVVGGALAVRGALNRPIPRLFGIADGGVEIQKTITVRAPLHRVFELWSRFDNFPRFMEHVREVRLGGDGRSTWTVDGPAGRTISFEAEVTELEPDRLIAWHTSPDQPIEHGGTVRFDEVSGGTRIHIHMTYNPFGGILGHAVARMLRWDPKARLDEDLVRMKALLEEGKTRAHHERVELAELL